LPVQAFGKILTDMSRRGQYERAIELYDNWADYYGWVTGFDAPKFNIAVMGWSLVHGRQDIFDRFHALLPDYKRSLALFSMLQEFEGQNLQVNDNLAVRIMRSEFHNNRLASSVAALGRLMMGRNVTQASHAHILR
jgi:hypothetical protein